MSVKGTFTQIDTSGEKAVIITRRVLYTDGFDAFLCATEGRGETEKRTGEPTGYSFTYDQTKQVIYLSEGYRAESNKEVVRNRTLGERKFEAGSIINRGITLKWLTPEENERLKNEYLATMARGEQHAAEDAKNYPIRYRCGECGNMIPKGRNKCRKCGSTKFVPV